MTESRILVVDSDGEHASQCDAFLSAQGFAVTVARDFPAATRALGTGRYDAVLLDAIVEGGDTSAIASAANDSGAALFGMSDILVGPTNREIAIGLHGCADFWEKPLAAPDVLGWLKRVLDDRFPSPPEPEPEPAAQAAPAPEPAPEQAPEPEQEPEPESEVPPDRSDDVTAGAPGFETAGRPSAEAAATIDVGQNELGRRNEWGHEPTRNTPHPAPPAVDQSGLPDDAATPVGAMFDAPDEAAADFDATPMPSESTRVATADEVAVAVSESRSGALPQAEVFAAAAIPDGPPSDSLTARRRTGSQPKVVQVQVPTSLDASHVGETGSLARTHFATVLGRFASDEASGVIRLTRGDVRKEVFLDAGAVVGVRSDAIEDRLSEILLADAVVRADQVEAMRRNLGAGALEHTATYVDAGLLDKDELAAFSATIARRRLLDLFAWNDGQWGFVAEAVPSALRVDIRHSTLELIWQGVQHGTPVSAVRTALEDRLGSPLAWIAQPPSREELVLTRWQRAIVGSIDGRTPATEVILGAPDRDVALCLVFTLVLGGFVGFAP